MKETVEVSVANKGSADAEFYELTFASGASPSYVSVVCIAPKFLHVASANALNSVCNPYLRFVSCVAEIRRKGASGVGKQGDC